MTLSIAHRGYVPRPRGPGRHGGRLLESAPDDARLPRYIRWAAMAEGPDWQALKVVSLDWCRFLNDAAGAHSAAGLGIDLLRQKMATIPRIPENPDPMIFSGIGDPNDPKSVFYHG